MRHACPSLFANARASSRVRKRPPMRPSSSCTTQAPRPSCPTNKRFRNRCRGDSPSEPPASSPAAGFTDRFAAMLPASNCDSAATGPVWIETPFVSMEIGIGKSYSRCQITSERDRLFDKGYPALNRNSFHRSISLTIPGAENNARRLPAGIGIVPLRRFQMFRDIRPMSHSIVIEEGKPIRAHCKRGIYDAVPGYRDPPAWLVKVLDWKWDLDGKSGHDMS